jgi:hypothetical protein
MKSEKNMIKNIDGSGIHGRTCAPNPSQDLGTSFFYFKRWMTCCLSHFYFKKNYEQHVTNQQRWCNVHLLSFFSYQRQFWWPENQGPSFQTTITYISTISSSKKWKTKHPMNLYNPFSTIKHMLITPKTQNPTILFLKKLLSCSLLFDIIQGANLFY